MIKKFFEKKFSKKFFGQNRAILGMLDPQYDEIWKNFVVKIFVCICTLWIKNKKYGYQGSSRLYLPPKMATPAKFWAFWALLGLKPAKA